MKKMISLLMIIVILVSVFVVPTFAYTTPVPTFTPDPNNLFEERLLERYYDGIRDMDPALYQYEELEYHYDENGEIDWALISTMFFVCEVDYGVAVACGRFWSESVGYFLSYSVYDVKEDRMNYLFTTDWSKYEGLREAVDRADIGSPIGDVNFNDEIDILDATKIQRLVSGIDYYDFMDEIRASDAIEVLMNDENVRYRSDFDRDGKRTVMDATAIQRHVAGIEVRSM